MPGQDYDALGRTAKLLDALWKPAPVCAPTGQPISERHASDYHRSAAQQIK